jgi:hypothetical protein
MHKPHIDWTSYRPQLSEIIAAVLGGLTLWAIQEGLRLLIG